MDIILVTTIIASLFLVIGAAEPLANYLRLPYAVIIACLGILVGVAATFFLRTELTDALNPVAVAILELPIRSNVFLYVFLPTLVFQVTLGLNLRRMADDWVPILVLAVVAVFVATFVVGYSLSLVSPLSLSAALLVGAIVSTTDPSAVVSIFRSISAPRRLARIIEGESLLNDAAAIALAALFMEFVMSGVPDPSLQSALARFPVLLSGGVLVGWFAARIAIWIMVAFSRYELAVISVSIALPYLAYIIAEQIVGASGVIAVVVAAMTLQLTGPGRLPPSTWKNLREVWDLLAHWAGALIFILAALLIPRMLETIQLSGSGPDHGRRRRGDRGPRDHPVRAASAADPPAPFAGCRTALPRGDHVGWPARRGHAVAGPGGDRELSGSGRRQATGGDPRHRLHAVHAAGSRHHAALGDRLAGAGQALAARQCALQSGDRRRAANRPRRSVQRHR